MLEALAPMPVTRPAGAILRYINIAPELQHHRPFHIRAQPSNPHLAIARIHLRLRMFIAIPVPDLENRQTGMDGVQECLCRRSRIVFQSHKVVRGHMRTHG